ncbi:MAG: hypothetical protein OXB95_01140 [Rhodobacteraceae bacterium]|nr:hypothetical protein [Paracoccaceae bacterium]
MSKSVILAACIAVLSAMSANAQEVVGLEAVKLMSKGEVIYSRTATRDEFGVMERVMEILLEWRRDLWICVVWTEGGPPQAAQNMEKLVGEQSYLNRYHSMFAGRSNVECNIVVPMVVE